MKISILTPSFNSGKYITRAIESVLRQEYKNVEHIVMDGGSTDGTVEILKQYSHLIWVSEPDQGQSDAMNKAFARSTGDIIVYLNADDELEPYSFSHAVAAFTNSPHLDMVVGNLRVCRPNFTKCQSPSIRLIDILNLKSPKVFPLNPVAYYYRRDLQIKVGRFPLDNHLTMDYWFLLRAYVGGKCLKIDAILGTFFFDGANKSSGQSNTIADLARVRESFISEYWYHLPVIMFVLSRFRRTLLIRLGV